MATQAPAGVDAAGLQIFQEVLQSLMLQHPLEETLGLISRRVCPLGEAAIAGSPTVSAIRRRETAVLTDALSDESFRPWRALATEFGYRSLVSAPLVVQGEVLGALNGYSARPRTLTAAQLETVETLASQAALALRLTMLVEAQHETIDQLREVNEQLREHRRMLERSHD